MEDTDLTPLIAQIIEKLNRIEANVAHLKSTPEDLKTAIDAALHSLNLCVARHGK